MLEEEQSTDLGLHDCACVSENSIVTVHLNSLLLLTLCYIYITSSPKGNDRSPESQQVIKIF